MASVTLELYSFGWNKDGHPIAVLAEIVAYKKAKRHNDNEWLAKLE
jgi:hypothetical protein